MAERLNYIEQLVGKHVNGCTHVDTLHKKTIENQQCPPPEVNDGAQTVVVAVAEVCTRYKIMFNDFLHLSQKTGIVLRR